jgi:hypothetical protein
MAVVVGIGRLGEMGGGDRLSVQANMSVNRIGDRH